MVRTGDKVAQIISQHFELQIAGVVLSYLFNVGIDNVKQITDKTIDEMEGNGLMDQTFVQAIVRTARNIAEQCSLYEDIIPFIICQLPDMNCQTRKIGLSKDGCEEDQWEYLGSVYGDDIEDHFGYEWDEVDNIVITGVVTEAEERRM